MPSLAGSSDRIPAPRDGSGPAQGVAAQGHRAEAHAGCREDGVGDGRRRRDDGRLSARPPGGCRGSRPGGRRCAGRPGSAGRGSARSAGSGSSRPGTRAPRVSAPPSAMTMHPCTCESRLAGFRMGPHSKASQISATSMRPFARSSPTSTQAATTESFSVPQARPTPRSAVTCWRRAAQPNCCRRPLEHGPEPPVLEVGQPELEGIGAGRRRQLVHEGLAGEVVGRRPEAPVRPLGQRRLRAHGGDPRVRDGVGSREGRAPRVDAREVPGDERARGASGPRGTRRARPAGSTPTLNSSSRVQRTETGFPAARARRAASTAASAVCFPPKPPPMSGTITRTRSRGMPSASARISCARKGPSQPAQTVRRSPFHSATAARGSIGACWMKATRYDSARTRSAFPSAVSTEPFSSVRASPRRAFARRCSNRFSFETGCGVVFQEAVGAAASSACAARREDGAAKPTNGPSRTATTSLIALAAERSIDSSVAPWAGGRRTRP